MSIDCNNVAETLAQLAVEQDKKFATEGKFYPIIDAWNYPPFAHSQEAYEVVETENPELVAWMHELANPTDHFTEAEVDPNAGQFDYDPNDDFKDAAR